MSELTRGGRKLEAAMAAFRLAGRVRGAIAIDVGASTGGFVSVLLAGGASRVTAIDVGHGQLAPELCIDPRVESLEHTDFKTLSLSVAPGPYDFFTVDVSFVAGRSMLRGLAFRLRPGAEGVVLVKPQFELPSHLVRDGKVDEPELRKRALDTFVDKAARLGFALVAAIDSPVAGGSGTVEMLAHLRFVGRPDSMPKPGERKPARPAAGKPQRLPGTLRWFAVAAPGLEAPLCSELQVLAGLTNVRPVDGGVEFEGPIEAAMAANLHSRIATRIVARLGEVKAREFAPLRRGFAKLPWPSFIAPDRPLRMDVTTHHCRLYHTGALADTVRLAIEDRVGKLAVPAPAGEDSEESVLPQTRILVRGQDDVFTVSVDSSGALLHQRGWRLEAGRAPLRETLAAGILSLAGYDPSSPLVDPMCGSGTFAIEAAAMARRIAPGLGRDFALVHWPVVESGRWQKVLAAAAEGRREGAPSSVVASDRDPEAVAMAKRNAARAGVEGDIRFAVAELGSCEVPTSPGLVILNPPYGRRLGWRQQVLRLGKDIGRTLASRFAGGWRAAVLCPDEAFVSAVAAGLRSKPAATHPLRNGGLRVTLAIWSIP